MAQHLKDFTSVDRNAVYAAQKYRPVNLDENARAAGVKLITCLNPACRVQIEHAPPDMLACPVCLFSLERKISHRGRKKRHRVATNGTRSARNLEIVAERCELCELSSDNYSAIRIGSVLLAVCDGCAKQLHIVRSSELIPPGRLEELKNRRKYL